MRVVESFPSKSKPVRGGQLEKFDSCMDGRCWELVEGKDFKGKAKNFRGTLASYARSKGFSARTSIIEKSLYFQVVGAREDEAKKPEFCAAEPTPKPADPFQNDI